MDDLKNKLDSLISELSQVRDLYNQLTSSSSFPRDVETAIRERIASLVATGSTGSYSTQVVSVVAGTVTVPSQPSGTLAVTVGNTTYNILYK